GTILGSLLFSIYISQLNSNMRICKIHYFADDTQLYASFHPSQIDEAVQKINSDLSVIVKNSEKHLYVSTKKKTVALLFGRDKTRSAYSSKVNINVNGKHIPSVQEARNLGLILDSNLHFKSHKELN